VKEIIYLRVSPSRVEGMTKRLPSPHLDVEQARRVRDALDAFIREREGD
jgi:hypothetical protein